ncbi:alpha/beta hydrolase [Pseudalkalibacillus berkeleyi]|uniref:Alpha/beta hydrolase n=1 Tax=Pseudalkalibacillus berkeleyi TaxID=1069813 RepID=A0ABS9H031_9BACL|nr:alpha/beta hydrolase [Pseudalkalibacillus berkeleyi]MCF6138358.1 alpha/beta hydrolase [Pseudalkalibacillus berkeleyi]
MWIWEAPEAKAVIVMVHGAGEHHGRYEWLCSKWVSKGYHVVMGDLPGQGLTRRNRGHIHSFDEYIETIESWVDEAKHFDLPIYLFGHSMGGLAVIRTVTEKNLPLAAVLLSSPALGIVEKPPKAIDAVSKVLNKVYPSLRLRSSKGRPRGTRSEEVLKRDSEDFLLVKKVSIRWYRELMDAMKAAFASVHRFPDLPLLVVQGGDDLIVDKEKVREWFNQLNMAEKAYKEWPALYHEVLNDPERGLVFQYIHQYVELNLIVREKSHKE